MTEWIDVADDARKDAADILGWRVAMSKRCWRLCVAEPAGGEGTTPREWLDQFLVTLGQYLREIVPPREVGPTGGINFCVANTSRERSAPPGSVARAKRRIPVAVLASIDRDGAPVLYVLTQAELPSWMRR